MSRSTEPSRSSDATIFFDDFQLDGRRRLLLKKGAPVRIGSRSLDILVALTDRAGEVVSKRDLLDSVWKGVVVDEAGLRVHMSSLRRALGDGRDDARYIVSVAGRGYSFVASVERQRASSPPESASATRPERQFPSMPRLFVGRDEVVAGLSTLLAKQRFVSIVGAGGIGKTVVAAAVVGQMRAEFGEEIVVVDLGAISEPGLVAGAVASAIGCTLGGVEPVEQLLSFVAERRMLIVLDSCEHLLDSTSLLAVKLLHHAPEVYLLVTSREPLRVEGETVHLLSPLAYPVDDCLNAAEAIETPAVQLFMHWASFSGSDGELGNADAPFVSEICRRSDGIPLAIELAASRVGTYGIRGVAELLAKNAELSLVGRRNVPPRHRTLQTMLDWSFALLAPDEQRVLARLSVFVGLFTIEAACSIAGEKETDSDAVATILAGLVDKSLVWCHPSSEAAFYRLPDTTRAYASRKLTEFEDADIASQRHALYFARLFRKIATEHEPHSDSVRHAPHVGNLRKALEWSFLDKERYAIGVALVADAAPLFLALWLFAEGRRWALAALAAIDDMSNDTGQEVRLQELLAQSSMHVRGNSQEVHDALDRGLNLSQSEASASPQLRLMAGLEIFLSRRGDFEGALAAAKRFASIAQRGGSRREQVIGEWMLGATYLAEDQRASLHHFERGFQLASDVSDLEVDVFGYNQYTRAMTGRARALWNRGFPRTACEHAHQLMNEAPRHHPTNYCVTVLYCTPVLMWSGDGDGWYHHIERVLAYAERYSLAPVAGVALALQGEWLVSTGNPSVGADILRQALKILHRENHHYVTSAALRALAEGLVKCGNHEDATATIDGAILSARQTHQKIWLSELYRTQGDIILRAPSPNFEAAEAALRESIELAKDQAAIGWELKSAVPLARLLLERERPSEALALIEPITETYVERTGTTDLAAAAEILALLK